MAATIAPFFAPGNGDLVTLTAVAAAIAALLVTRGTSPVTFLATAAFAIVGAHATVGGFFTTGTDARHLVYWVAMLGMVALLLRWRKHGWTSATLAGQMIPLVLSFAIVLDDWNVGPSQAIELSLGAYLGVFLGLGIYLGERGLVAGAALGLLIDALAFAFDVGGALTAFLLLGVLGGLLVWQAEFLRAFFARRART